jgi:hypothetical protein
MITTKDVHEFMEKMAFDFGENEFDNSANAFRSRSGGSLDVRSTPKPAPAAPRKVNYERNVRPKATSPSAANRASKEKNSISTKLGRFADRIGSVAEKAIDVATQEQKRALSGGRPLRDDETVDILTGRRSTPEWVTKVRDINHDQQVRTKSIGTLDERKKIWASERDREMKTVMPRYGKSLEEAKVDSEAEAIRRVFPGADEKRVMESAKATAPSLAISDKILLNEGAYHKELDSGKGRNVPQVERIADEERQEQELKDFWNALESKRLPVHQLAGVSTM